MSSLGVAASPLLRREEAMPVAFLLAFAGGYIDAYTWIVHGVMANAQTANLVLLWVHGSAGNWPEALHFLPPMAAFAVGVVLASWLYRAAGERAGSICILLEILLLVVVGVLHNRLPDLAGTLGISCVAAMQSAAFTKVEGAAYSSVMITGNLRQAIESLFAALSSGCHPGALRRSGILVAVCAAFGVGAAFGAFATKLIPSLTLAVPAAALLIVFLRCEGKRKGKPL